MKIGIVKQQFVRLGGGSERYTMGLVEGLKRLGYALHVFTTRWDASAERQDLTLHHVPVLGGFSFTRKWSFAHNCRRAIEGAPCDTVFSLERTLRQDIARAGGGCHREWLAQRARHATPWQRFGFRLDPLHAVLLRLERQTFSPANTRCLIANSQRGKAEIIRHYGFPAERIVVIHNGVDPGRFRPSPHAPRESFVVLLVGSGYERKGLGFAIRALARLPARVRLRVAGKGNRRPYLRLAARLGVADRLEFLGAAARMEEVYGDGDLLVHPAMYEPFSNACLEAMACGLPVVTSRINGASEIIEPGRNGAVVEDPGDIPALAQAIESFLDPHACARAGQAARQTAEAMPMTRNVEATLAVIQQLRSPPGSPLTVGAPTS